MGRVAVDLFAGGGGASEGIRRAFGVAPIVAVNHDPHAIAMHAANHPSTIHFQESVFAVDPRTTVRGPVDLLWASPDCKHFSRAKGGVPRDKRIRALAWVIVDWAAAIRPTVIAMENVAEFTTWGPLDDDGQPIKARAGETFRQFVGALESLGYAVEWRQLVAADYGAPTTRKRFFLVARNDGAAIAWPKPTHGKGRAPWRTAAECIDWTLPIPSIFERARPLAEKTQRRIAEGIRRFVIESGKPFLVPVKSWGGGGNDARSLDEPMRTTTTSKRGEHAIVAPTLIANNTNNRPHHVEEPVPTVTTGPRNYLAAAHLVHHNGDSIGRAADEPLRTVVGAGCNTGILAASLIQAGYGEREGQAPRALDLERPLGTVVAGGNKHAIVAAWLAKHYGDNGQRPGVPLHEPAGTVTAVDHHALAAAFVVKNNGGWDNRGGQDVAEPLHTITGRDNKALVAAFLLKFYGSGGQWSRLSEPMHTIVAKARMGLVTVDIGGEEYAIADIGMRMLTPRELARAQGFPDSYMLHGTKEQQIARIGNSVPPQLVEAVVRANFPDDVATEAA